MNEIIGGINIIRYGLQACRIKEINFYNYYFGAWNAGTLELWNAGPIKPPLISHAAYHLMAFLQQNR
jgi:hypothetical protein